MDTTETTRPLTALEINLERTKAVVEIPEEYRILLDVAKNHYGILKRTEELLIELHHPFVNWEYVLAQLKTISIGDFYDFNTHEEGLPALKKLADIYLVVISSARDEEIRDSAVRYCFEYLNTILSNSNTLLKRNAALFSPVFRLLVDLSRTQSDLLKKSSSYMKTTARLLMESRIKMDDHEIHGLLSSVFKSTYRFWLTQSDPSRWFSTEGETQETRDAYRELIAPLSHEHIRGLLTRLEDLDYHAPNDENPLAPYLDIPDYLQIANGYLVTADALERSSAFEGRRYLTKLDFLFNMMNNAEVSEVRNAGLIEINRCLGRALCIWRRSDGLEYG